jgi:hypothetical protein
MIGTHEMIRNDTERTFFPNGLAGHIEMIPGEADDTCSVRILFKNDSFILICQHFTFDMFLYGA